MKIFQNGVVHLTMCCRYYFGEETAEYVRSVVGKINAGADFRAGDIHPSESAVVITGKTPVLCAESMQWGFLSPFSKQLLINARSETAFEKRSFSDSMESRRCIISARHFYEWDRQKNIVTFTVPDRNIILMAGIWNTFEDGKRFTILTAAANSSMLPVHDRMPVILNDDMLHDWITDTAAAKNILKEKQPELLRRQQYEQLSLFSY